MLTSVERKQKWESSVHLLEGNTSQETSFGFILFSQNQKLCSLHEIFVPQVLWLWADRRVASFSGHGTKCVYEIMLIAESLPMYTCNYISFNTHCGVVTVNMHDSGLWQPRNFSTSVHNMLSVANYSLGHSAPVYRHMQWAFVFLCVCNDLRLEIEWLQINSVPRKKCAFSFYRFWTDYMQTYFVCNCRLFVHRNN